MLNLNDLAFYVRVVEHGGFAAAARQLKVPKSTLSKRVAELEKQLGVRLIQRTSRSFVPTEVGEEVYRHATAMMVEAEAAQSVVHERLAEPRGTVRITASVPTAQLVLAEVLPEAARRWPLVHIALHAADRFVDVVQEGFDIALRDHFSPLPDSDLVQRRVASDPFCLIAAPEYLRHRGTPVQPQDLAPHDGLIASHSESMWRLADHTGAVQEVRPVPRFTADESMVLLAAAAAGLGITALPYKLCRPYFEAGTLVHVLPDWTAGTVNTTLLMPHRRGQLPAVRVVADFLADRIATAP